MTHIIGSRHPECYTECR